MKAEHSSALAFGQLPSGLTKKLIEVLADRVRLYDFLCEVKGLYLPGAESCSMQFLLDLFTGKARAVSKAAVKDLGREPDLKVRRADLLRIFEHREDLKPYFPMTTYQEKKYLVNMLAVLDKPLFNELSLKHSLKSKVKPEQKKKQLYVDVSAEFAESLLRMPAKPDQPILLKLMILKSPHSTPKKPTSNQSTPRKPTSATNTPSKRTSAQGTPAKETTLVSPNKRIKLLDDS
mmetsp:Transcript_7330/g.13571  ORF Transcript_7330/g.13571 Transcript_7330/m.13571 type:complete len:233 (+) Transcript_7330:772-1470(+)